MTPAQGSEFGELLRYYRRDRGLTQEELAELATLSVRAISDLERGLKYRPRKDTVQLLAAALGLSDADRSPFGLAARGQHASQGRSEQPKGLVDPADVVGVRAAGEDPSARSTGHDGTDRVEGGEEAGQSLPIGGFLGSLPAGALVARADELITVLETVEAVGRRQGRLVLVAGEAGIGKTRLAQEVTSVVYGRKFLVAAGRCYEPQRSIPYYPFLEALRIAYVAAPASIRSQAGRRWSYLSRLLPDQLDSLVDTPSRGPEEQELLFRAVTGFLQAIADVTPVAILLDDLHWADSASLQLLHHLARQTRSSPVLILGTYRDAEVDPQHPLEATLRDLSREQLLERVTLRRLQEKDTAAFISASVGAVEAESEFAALVHRHTDGNPFFTQQVLRMLIENGSLYRRNGAWQRREIQEIEVPESVRSVIAQRIARLDPEAQEILHEASVLGPAFSFDDLLAMRLPDDDYAELEDAVDVALTGASTLGLVRMTGKDRYVFDHALTQQALYAALSPRRRRRLHLLVGRALEKLPERKRRQRAAELAWHFLQGDDADKAIAYALLAGDGAEEVFAHQEAERHYRMALELIKEVEGPQTLEAQALEKLGAVLKTSSRYEEGRSILANAAHIYHTSGDVESEGRAEAQIGAIEGLTGVPEDGINRLEPFVELLEQRPLSPSLATLYVVLVRLYNVTGRQQDQFKASERLVDLARDLQDERLLAEAEVHRGVALIHTGQIAQAIPVLEAAIEGAERIGDLHTLCTAMDFASYCYYSQRDLERTMRYRERIVEVAEQLGDPFEISYRTVEAAYVTFLIGDWRRSREFAERGLTALLDSNNLRAFLQPLYSLSELSLYEGKWEEAVHYAQECITIAQHLGRVDALRDAHALLAEMALMRDDVGAALEHVRPFVGTPDWDEQVTFLLALGSAHLASGQLDDAEDAAAKAVAEVTRQRLPTGLVDALRLQGAIALHRGAWQEAEAHLQRAIQLGREIIYPWGEAQALLQYGLMWAERDEPQPARTQLAAAAAIFARLGATPHRAKAEHVLKSVSRLQRR